MQLTEVTYKTDNKVVYKAYYPRPERAKESAEQWVLENPEKNTFEIKLLGRRK